MELEFVFSVIIPVYNHADTLTKAIESVLQQTFPSFELIVVNDGSTEDIDAIVDKYRRNIHNFVYINKGNGGVSDARNVGINHARGNYICFLDADDEYYDNHLSTIKDLIDRYGGGMMYVTSHETVLLIGESTYSNTILTKIKKDSSFLVDDLFDILWKAPGTIIHINSVCIDKDIFKSVGCFEKGVKIGEDIDLFCRIGAYYNVAFTQNVTTKRYRENSMASKTGNFDYNWIFEKKVPELLSDEAISDKKKENLKIYMNIRNMRKILHYCMMGDKSEARRCSENLYRVSCISTRYIILRCRAAIGALLPDRLLRWMFARRNRGFFR